MSSRLTEFSKRSSSIHLVGFLSAVAVAVLAACGGGGDDASTNVSVSPAAAPTVKAAATVSSDQMAVTLSAHARDAAGAIIEDVDFVLDGVRLQVETSRHEEGVILTLPTDIPGSGAHSLVVVARDQQGNEATSSPVAFSLPQGPAGAEPASAAGAGIQVADSADKVAPTVTGGAVTGQFGLITLSAVARDNVAVQALYFHVDGKSAGGAGKSTLNASGAPVLGVDGAPTSLVFDATGLADGIHVFSARAIDTSRNASLLQEVRFVVDSSKGLREVEPNNTAATANAVGAHVAQIVGTLNGRIPGTPLLDKDVYKVKLAANGSLRLDWVASNLTRSATDRLVVEVQDIDGKVIAKAEDKSTQLIYRNGAQARDVYVGARVLSVLPTPRMQYQVTLSR